MCDVFGTTNDVYRKSDGARCPKSFSGFHTLVQASTPKIASHIHNFVFTGFTNPMLPQSLALLLSVNSPSLGERWSRGCISALTKRGEGAGCNGTHF